MKKILFACCLAMMALAFTSCGGNSPVGVVNEYIECLKSGDYEKAVDLMHFNKELTDEDKQQLVDFLKDKMGKSIESKQGIASFTVDNADLSEDGESANVSYTINYGDGTSKTDNGKVVKVGNEWKIESGK